MKLNLISFLISFALSMLLMPRLIRALSRRRVEQVISEDVPEHLGKQGTPTLGGIGIIIPTIVVCSGFVLVGITQGDQARNLVAVAVVTVMTSLLGLVDDYLILNGGRNAGQKWNHKLIGQMLIATGFILYLFLSQQSLALTRIQIPERMAPLELGWWWYPLAILFMAGMSNAVNLSDGLDGLAGGLSLIACVICGAAAMAVMRPELALFCAALAGGCLGFLWFNCHPADIFMGNTSSIALGMALASVAIMTGREIALIVAFGVFVAEAMSVIIQVGYYKLTHRRVLKKAPIHHHFEMIGWKETRIVARFWITAIILSVLSYLWMNG